MSGDFSFSARILSSRVYTYPFPHLVIENFLPIDVYKELELLFEDSNIRDHIPGTQDDYDPKKEVQALYIPTHFRI